MTTTIQDSPQTQIKPSRHWGWWLTLFVVLLMAVYAVVRWQMGLPIIGPAQLHGFVMQSPKPVTNFTLIGHDGEEVSLHDFQDKVVLLYFGYTFCPDVCPATLSHLNRAVAQLPAKQQEQVQVVMVTVDPERDTPDVLADYVAYFNPSFIGLSGTEEQVASAATNFGIYYEKQAGSEATGYLVDHTTTVAVIDKDGYLRLIYPMDVSTNDVAEDLNILVRE